MGLLTSSKIKALVASDENHSSHGGRSSNNNKKSSGRKNHKLRHKNHPHIKAILLPTRREVMKRRINFFEHIAKIQIMMRIIERLREWMSWKIYSRRTSKDSTVATSKGKWQAFI